MAPLFINLTLWIGVFMLMVIMRLEVDGEGIAGLTAAQRYFGRWLLLAAMAALQAAVCCAGCLVMGVQATSAPLFFLTAIIASQAYLAIQYMLSTLFQHVGKGLCIVLVFVQIPAATGLYPIEMTTPFFQAVYPAFPFTYGIGAMREIIGGIYDGAWASDIAVLGVFFVVAMALGVVLRSHLVNLNRRARSRKAASSTASRSRCPSAVSAWRSWCACWLIAPNTAWRYASAPRSSCAGTRV